MLCGARDPHSDNPLNLKNIHAELLYGTPLALTNIK